MLYYISRMGIGLTIICVCFAAVVIIENNPYKRNGIKEEYQCQNTSCNITWIGDDPDDLRDNQNETCQTDQFTCANGNCVELQLSCNRIDDCGDNSDEVNCLTKTCLPDKEFACNTVNNTHCLPVELRCDGDTNCPNFSDEMNCPDQSSDCERWQFACPDHVTCIHPSRMCDGTNDCPDGGDEKSELCKDLLCESDQFLCRDRSCIADYLQCSGTKDCLDGSDEEECKPGCNPYTLFCTYPDLSKIEDEPIDKIDVNECLVNKGNCSHICVDTLTSFHCDCRPGYKLMDDGQNCEDINECEDPTSCSQICHNEEGTYSCECENGYLRDQHDHTLCKANQEHGSFFFSDQSSIYKISLDQPEMTVALNNTKSTIKFDFFVRSGTIFWLERENHKIFKAPIDDVSNRTLVVTDVMTSDAIAVDWIYNHIYWKDSGKDTIELADFDGKIRKVIMTGDMSEIRVIAVDPIEGWMFWNYCGYNPKIERAGLDGSHRETIISEGMIWPISLTLDLEQRRVYWADGMLYQIYSSAYDGSARRMVVALHKSLGFPTFIGVFVDQLYWTDWHYRTILQANKFNGSNVIPVTGLPKLPFLRDLHVYHPYIQPDGINHCVAENSNCSYLCLPAPQINPQSPRFTCACPDGTVLQADGRTCTEYSSSSDEVDHKLSTEV